MSLIVTLTHLRTVPGLSKRPGYCSAGTRAFFIRYGLDWAEFRKHGLPAEAFTATGDALALRLVDWARQQAAASGHPQADCEDQA